MARRLTPHDLGTSLSIPRWVMHPRNRSGAAHHGSGGAEYDRFMEGENDALINGLAGKVSQLKELTIAIGADVRDQNNMLDNISNSFDSAGSLLDGTRKRLGAFSKMGGDCSMPMLALFVFFVFIFVWRMTH